MHARALIITLALACTLVAGCRNRWRRPPQACPPSATAIPPAGIPEGPPPIAPVPRVSPPPSGGGAELILPQNPPSTSRSQYPSEIPPSKKGAILGDPDYVEKPKIDEADSPKAEVKKPNVDDTPAGIADFAEVRDGVATGQRPTIDGLDWLKSKRYKSILYVRGPDENDTSDRRQIELRDMNYVSLVVTPETLTKEWIERFNQIVADASNRPIFVYGDPATLGPVWYLNLRMADYWTHDEARVAAKRYGLKEESSAMFKAALKLLPPSK